MSAAFDFDLAKHPEADLLRLIVQASAIFDAGEVARRRGERPYLKWVKANCHEAVALDDKIAATRAHTPEAIRAKVEYALRDAEPEKRNLGKGSIFAVAYSALWDVMAADA